MSTAKLQAQAVFGPTPYTSFSNSPFNSITFSYFHLETFEGGFNVPGVNASAGSIQGPGGLTDSVDVDDGLIDGSGTNGRSYFFSGGQAGIRFTFDVGVLGLLPTHAGIVWTDGVNNIRFEAFDAANNSLGILNGNHAGGTFNGQTDEDRFYGINHDAGIGSILIQSTNFGGIELDHLQYGFAAVPEPGSLALMGLVTAGASAYTIYRRRKHKVR
jgi:hypothetical protein